MVIFVSITLFSVTPNGEEIDLPFKIAPFVAVVQLGFAVTGIISGLNFLKMKAWARRNLEILTWFLLCFAIGFTCFFVALVFHESSSGEPLSSPLSFIVMGILGVSVYVIPMIMMLKHLRSQRVKDAVSGSTDLEKSH